jgi:hypothetical protein
LDCLRCDVQAREHQSIASIPVLTHCRWPLTHCCARPHSFEQVHGAGGVPSRAVQPQG